MLSYNDLQLLGKMKTIAFFFSLNSTNLPLLCHKKKAALATFCYTFDLLFEKPLFKTYCLIIITFQEVNQLLINTYFLSCSVRFLKQDLKQQMQVKQ